MKVNNDCPKGYKRQELVDLAKENGIRITRLPPLKGSKNMTELCDDLKKSVKKTKSSRRRKIDIKRKVEKTVTRKKQSKPIIKVNKNEFDIEENGYDPINMTDIKIKDYLKEDKDNIAIKYKDNYYLTTKDIIRDNMGSAIFRTCKESLLTLDINKMIEVSKNGLELYNLTKIGIPIGFIKFIDILNALKNNKQKYIVKDTDLVAKSSISNAVIVELMKPPHLRNQGYLFSASHCQEGQGGPIRTLYTIK